VCKIPYLISVNSSKLNTFKYKINKVEWVVLYCHYNFNVKIIAGAAC